MPGGVISPPSTQIFPVMPSTIVVIACGEGVLLPCCAERRRCEYESNRVGWFRSGSHSRLHQGSLAHLAYVPAVALVGWLRKSGSSAVVSELAVQTRVAAGGVRGGVERGGGAGGSRWGPRLAIVAEGARVVGNVGGVSPKFVN
mgnify:CR=1 FL=1